MSRETYINYDDIVKNEQALIDYLAKNSDTFSVLVILKKPYSQDPPAFNYDVQLRPFVKQYIYERSARPVRFLSYSNHQIMVVCHCNGKSRKQLLQMPNLFLAEEGDLPEDICFYRNGQIWFATISHEKLAFALDVTEEDVSFLKKNNIRFSV